MSSLLTLQAPVPTSALVFEDLFFGDYNEMIALSRLRAEASRSMSALETSDPSALDGHIAAIDAYVSAWREFIARTVYNRGSSARSAMPLIFTWRHGEREYSDSSPLFESAAMTLALAVALQRRGAVAAVADVERAAAELETLADKTLEPLFVARVRLPPRRTNDLRSSIANEPTRWREPQLLSAAYHRSVASAIRGQALVKRAVTTLQEHGKAAAIASSLFASVRAFAGALTVLPAESSFRRARTTVEALAQRYTAQALLEELDTDTARAVAVTLSRHAHALDGSNVSIERYMRELEDRNRLEFGMLSVPSRESVLIRASSDETFALVEDAGTWTVTL